MISVVLAASNGWVTISQSRHGAQLNTIKSQMAGEQLDYGPMVQQTLGYLWDLPASSTSTRGLGGGITWAWDPTLCDDLQPQFREDFFFIEYISCRDLKAAMHRGFSSWSANHPHIHFVEVTTECEHLDKERGGEGKAWKECPLVEIWVTGIAPPPPPPAEAVAPPPPSPDAPPPAVTPSPSPPARRRLDDSESIHLGGVYNQESGGDAAATALPAAKVSYDFRYTSGMPAGVIDAQGRSNPKPTIETYGATLSFNTQLCWCARRGRDTRDNHPSRALLPDPPTRAHRSPPLAHPLLRYLDSTFCARFHALKEHVDPPEMLEAYGRIAIFCLFAAVVAFEGCQLLSLARKVCSPRNFGAISAQFRRDSSDARLALGRCAATAGRRASSATPSSTRSPSGRSSARRCGC